MSIWISFAGMFALVPARRSAGFSADSRLSPSRRGMQLTAACDTPTSAVICFPVALAAQSLDGEEVAGAIWLGNERLGGAITQTVDTAREEPFHPFGDSPSFGVELARGGFAHAPSPWPLDLAARADAK